ncbi:MAG: sulfatase-like hydrolase/transferase, partial [Planctomycetota bacterium]
RDGGPFCLVIALVEPHVPWTMGDASRYPVQELKLPAHIADTPRTRRDFAAYLAEITYMDRQVGDILRALEASGRAADTLVLFTSEQGAQFPGCKWTNYDAGVHTALVARWPGRIAPAARTGALVQYADVLPTLMEIAGVKISRGTFDGTSFRAVLFGESRTHREYVFGVHNNVPEGPPYPIRSITDGAYHYLRNLTPEAKYYEKHLMGQGRLNNPYWATWVRSAETDERTARLVKRYTERPREELFRLSDDRHEMKNLTGDPEHEPVRARLSKALDEWLRSQGDPGVPQDTREAHQAAKEGKHKYYPPE